MSEYEDADPRYFDPIVLVGVWANSTRVHRGRDEFTLDFLRHLPDRSDRFLVARTVVTPVVAVELRDQLDEAWRGYSEWSMPETTT